MIICNLNSLKDYENLNKGFKKVKEFLENNDIKSLVKGKIDLGDDDFVNVLEPEGKGEDFNLEKLELHKNYIDVQVPVIDNEILFFDNIENCATTLVEYNSEKDVAFVMSKTYKKCYLNENDIAILFPNDAHYAIKIKKQNGKKLVFKISGQELVIRFLYMSQQTMIKRK